jgi:phosphinothricin acetyltransferase
MGPSKAALRIRPGVVDDLPPIRAIYNHYVATSTCTFQIELETEQERATWFRERTAAHPVTVAEWDGEVIAWAALSPWRPRGAYAHTVEASVYVRHDMHQRGIGRALLADLIERARAAGHRTILGGACSEQTASIRLQEQLGFQQVGHFRQVGHKFGRWLDVVYMQLVL